MSNFSLHTKKRGFTLIELLVSVAIFSIVMVMALGSLLALSAADRKAETLKSAIDNLTFGLDSMSRAIRTGYGYHCGSGGTLAAPQDCNGTGANYLTFTGSDGKRVYYQLDTTTSVCGQAGTIGCIERSSDGATWLPITSPDLVIQNYGYLFHVVGAPTGDNVQPKVIMTINATVTVSTNQTTSVHMQTTVTQRIYDQ
jgi:prepilin-type N-terminal cleavage/methylation domain-containing protein